jgi:hypothetical protein
LARRGLPDPGRRDPHCQHCTSAGLARGAERPFGVGAPFSSPLVGGGVIFIDSVAGTLYALE